MRIMFSLSLAVGLALMPLHVPSEAAGAASPPSAPSQTPEVHPTPYSRATSGPDMTVEENAPSHPDSEPQREEMLPRHSMPRPDIVYGTSNLRSPGFTAKGSVEHSVDPQTGDIITSVVPPVRNEETPSYGTILVAPQIYPDRGYNRDFEPPYGW